MTVEINRYNIPNPLNIPNNLGMVGSQSTIAILPINIPKNEILLSVAQGLLARTITMTLDEIGTYNATDGELNTTKIPSGSTWYIRSIYSTHYSPLHY